MSHELCQPHVELTNGDVADALTGYSASRDTLLDLSLAAGVFSRKKGPFGFDLGALEDVRKAIDEVVRPPRSRAISSRPPDNLDPFRRELIFATSHASRRDDVRLVLSLYIALMERHKANVEDMEATWKELKADGATVRPERLDPSSTAWKEKPSAAGEYLLRCFAVQAAYDNFATYTFVLYQFLCVVFAIKMANAPPEARDAVLAEVGPKLPLPTTTTTRAPQSSSGASLCDLLFVSTALGHRNLPPMLSSLKARVDMQPVSP